MQNPSVMALFLPVASRLSSRTGLSLAAPAAADGRGDRDGRRADHGRQLAADPAQRPAGVGQRQPALGRGHAGTAARCSRRCRSASRCWRLGCCISASSAASCCARTRTTSVTPARTESYFANTYGIDGDVFELTVTAESPLVGMSLGDAEALHDAPLLLALQTGNESRLSPSGRQTHLGRQRARRDGPARARAGLRAEPVPAHCRRACATSATCSIPAAPAFPKR